MTPVGRRKNFLKIAVMTAKELISLESGNHDEIRLYKVGMFWCAYERSAYMMCSQVRELKVKADRVKSAGGQVLCKVGFPLSSFDTTAASLVVKSRTDDVVVLKAPRAITEEQFLEWKNTHTVADSSAPSAEGDIVKMIRGFNVAVHTPMQCMDFIMELQRLTK